ncbi:hypothetical protein GCM10020254_84110 [Streptomyces goshikiensis]
MKEWNGEGSDSGRSQAEAFKSKEVLENIASGQFQGPGSTLDSGEEFSMEKIVTIPKGTRYETLDAVLQFAILRQDRGKLDDEFYSSRRSWVQSEGRCYCQPDVCGKHVIYHGRVRYNNNLINVTRKPRYVATFWSPEEEPQVFISSFNFKKKRRPASRSTAYMKPWTRTKWRKRRTGTASAGSPSTRKCPSRDC